MFGHSESSIVNLLGRALLGATLIISTHIAAATCTNTVHDDDHVYSLPYASNKSYRVLQGFGSRFSHTGLEEFAIDIDMSVGTPVHAARGGVVAEVEESHNRGCWDDGCGKYANFIVVRHSDGTTGEYYHLRKSGSIVDVGDTVTKGQKIGYSGIPDTRPCRTFISLFIVPLAGEAPSQFLCASAAATVLLNVRVAAHATRPCNVAFC